MDLLENRQLAIFFDGFFLIFSGSRNEIGD